MKFIIEEIQTKEKVLIITDILTEPALSIKKEIRRKNVDVDFLTFKSKNKIYFDILSYQFVIVFLINTKKTSNLEKILSPIKDNKKTLILTNNKNIYDAVLKLLEKDKSSGKVILFSDSKKIVNEFDTLLWFLFSEGKEKGFILDFNFKNKDESRQIIFKKKQKIPYKYIFAGGVLGLLCLLIISIPAFFILSFWKLDRIIKTAQNVNIDTAYENYEKSVFAKNVTIYLYSISRPIFSLLFLSPRFDSYMTLLKNSYSLVENSLITYKNAEALIGLITKEEKTNSDKEYIKLRINFLNKRIPIIAKYIISIEDFLKNEQLPFANRYLQKIKNLRNIVLKIQPFIPLTQDIIGLTKNKKYLIFFYNNMELRPGGGFIGSFATISFENGWLSSFEIYDVYDADGRLTMQIKPPIPIQTFLNQTNWYLRDSNFSPDFPTNVEVGEFFLKKEMNFAQFDGFIGITTSSLYYMLEAFPPVYISDYKEYITKDNFYIKTQTAAETDFFSGSTKKKSFLSVVAKTMLINLQKSNKKTLLENIIKSLDEKQIVVHFKKKKIQSKIDEAGWGGKMISPLCIKNQDNCISNYIFPVDANLGANKVNYYIDRSIKTKIVITPDGYSNETITIFFRNRSPANTLIGGNYMNYFQLYLPKKTEIKKVILGNQKETDYKSRQSKEYLVIEIPIFIKTNETKTLSISYKTPSSLRYGKGLYQLIIQKQIGLINTSFSLEVILPKNIEKISQNFAALEKDNILLYNTDLSCDKVFFIEINKKK